MKKAICITMLMLLAASLATCANAVVIWSDDFSSYPYGSTGGDAYMGTAGWSNIGGESGYVTDYNEATTPQYLLYPSNTLSRSFGEMGSYTTLKVKFDVFSNNPVVQGFTVTLKDSQSGNAYSLWSLPDKWFGTVSPYSGFCIENWMPGIAGTQLSAVPNDIKTMEITFNKVDPTYPAMPSMFVKYGDTTVLEWWDMPVYAFDTLQFSSKTGNWVIDNVSVEMSSVPEPGSIVALLTGLTGLCAACLRRRNK